MVVRYKWDGEDPRVEALQAAMHEDRAEAVEHELFGMMTSIDRVRTFMSLHVFAVWDFMSLLKSLQQRLTCVEVPWTPRGDGLCRRLINDIVLVEESDDCGDEVMSHFELYQLAMAQAGADTGPLLRFLDALQVTKNVPASLDLTELPEPAEDFVRSTWDVLNRGQVHELAAVFAFGRESLIPAMFTHVLEGDHCVPLFRDYLERHVEVDGEEHTPMAVQMVLELCGDDDDRWAGAQQAVTTALQARRRLWDGIREAIWCAESRDTRAGVI
jgi:hypothetical protein